MILVQPVGMSCNLRCDYCYEQSHRDKTPSVLYDRDAVMSRIDTAHGPWHLFGGEPLLVHITHLEELLKAGYEKWGYTAIQTNGTLITPAHVELFEKYKTQIGISLDGPDELNDSRWAGTVEATRRATEKTFHAIDMLLELSKRKTDFNYGPTLIVTLHGGNCSVERWPRMKEWIRELDRKGVTFINFHFMERDNKYEKWFLPDERLIDVMRELASMRSELTQLKFLNFDEIIKLLRGNNHEVHCVWTGCDPYCTGGEQDLMNDGSPANCYMGIKDGVSWLPAEGDGKLEKWPIGEFVAYRHHPRQLSLYVTPPEHGGCKGCRFWMMCQGYCPGSGEQFDPQFDGDWRLKTTQCNILKAQFEEMEQRLVAVGDIPVSLYTDREQIEQEMYREWTVGNNITMYQAIQRVRNPQVTSVSTCESSVPHGDAHGDHYDNNVGRQG